VGTGQLNQIRVYNRKLSYSGDWVLFGYPFLVTFNEGYTNGQITQLINSKLRDYVQSKELKYSIFISYYEGVDHGKSLPKDDGIFKEGDKVIFALNWEPEVVDLVSKAKDNIIQHNSLKHQFDDEELIVPLCTCFDLFTGEEVLRESNSWFCSTCKQSVTSKKQLSLTQLPEILVLHLKRFQYTTIYRDKITSTVDFPLNDLDMGPYLGQDKPALYDLYAISNHIGGMSGGHYTAYTLNKNDKNWYKFDDSKCSAIDASQVVSPDAYLLFYRLRGISQNEWPEYIIDDDEEEEKSKNPQKETEKIHKDSENFGVSSSTNTPQASEYKNSKFSPDWRNDNYPMEDRMEGHDREFGYDADYDERRLPPLPVVPETGHHRRNHGGPDFAGNYDGEGGERNPLAQSGYICTICNNRLQGLEELQVHLLTTHYDDPNARSMFDL